MSRWDTLREHLSSDLLSPVMVKELRQELRLRSFSLTFLLPQIVMFFVALIELAEANTRTESGLANTFFWLTMVMMLLVMIPRRGFFSFVKDTDPKSMELVVLTRLSAWKIIFGKWAALALQALLFVVAISPYVMLRYFLGDADPLGTFEVIFLMVLGSFFLSAMGICASASGSKSRILGSPVGALIFGIYVVSYAVTGSSVVSRSSILSIDDYIVLAFLGPLAVLALFEIAIANIAPPLENYALRKRLIGILCLAASAGLMAWGIHIEGTLGITALLILVPLCASSLFERPHPLLLRGLRQNGSLFQWLVYPGWPGGVLYTLAMAAAIMGLLALNGQIAANPLKLIIYLWGGILMPQILMNFFFSENFRTVFAYLLIQCFLVSFAALFYSYKSYALTSYFPMSVFILEAAGDKKAHASATIAVTLLSIMVLIWQFRALKRQTIQKAAADA